MKLLLCISVAYIIFLYYSILILHPQVTSLVIESDKIKLFDIDSLVFKKNERVTTKQASEPNLQVMIYFVKL